MTPRRRKRIRRRRKRLNDRNRKIQSQAETAIHEHVLRLWDGGYFDHFRPFDVLVYELNHQAQKALDHLRAICLRRIPFKGVLVDVDVNKWKPTFQRG